jgi:hypothetical protein
VRAAVAGLAILATAIAAQPASAAVPPVGDGNGGFALTQIGNFTEPVGINQAPGKRNRRLLFVPQQNGRIVVLRNGAPLAQPFLDISSQVQDSGEQGMLSMAFHPGYESNRRFYVYFTNPLGDEELVEFKRAKGSRVVANPASERLVLYIPHPTFGNHNGGTLQFDSKQRLYLAPGDGGGGNDPPNNAQNPNSLLGKVLRIDPLPSSARRKGKGRAAAARATRPYTIPRGNPFAAGGGRPEVFALGLRNPFRFTFDALTGAIAIGDVGQECREEVDYRLAGHLAGVNFGWARFEGNFLLMPSRAAPGAIPPILEYTNNGASGSCPRLGGFTGISVIAGYVVRDPRLVHQYGRLLYTDFGNDDIRSLIPSEAGAADDRSTGVSLPGFGQPDAFGQGRGGVLWVVSHAGPIYRLDPR